MRAFQERPGHFHTNCEYLSNLDIVCNKKQKRDKTGDKMRSVLRINSGTTDVPYIKGLLIFPLEKTTISNKHSLATTE